MARSYLVDLNPIGFLEYILTGTTNQVSKLKLERRSTDNYYNIILYSDTHDPQMTAGIA